MNQAEFYDQYQCRFIHDERTEELYRQLKAYYDDSENMDNARALVRYRQFREWAASSGYSQQEINRAKRCLA